MCTALRRALVQQETQNRLFVFWLALRRQSAAFAAIGGKAAAAQGSVLCPAPMSAGSGSWALSSPPTHNRLDGVQVISRGSPKAGEV